MGGRDVFSWRAGVPISVQTASRSSSPACVMRWTLRRLFIVLTGGNSKVCPSLGAYHLRKSTTFFTLVKTERTVCFSGRTPVPRRFLSPKLCVSPRCSSGSGFKCWTMRCKKRSELKRSELKRGELKRGELKRGELKRGELSLSPLDFCLTPLSLIGYTWRSLAHFFTN